MYQCHIDSTSSIFSIHGIILDILFYNLFLLLRIHFEDLSKWVDIELVHFFNEIIRSINIAQFL